MGFLKKYRQRLLLSFICALASLAFSLAIPRLLGEGVDTVLGYGERSSLIWLAVALLVASGLRGFAAFGYTYFTELVSQRTSYDIRNALYAKL